MPVSCRDCGYLALRNFRTRELMEAESGVRDNWKLPHTEEGFGSAAHRKPIYVFKPLCFMMEEQFFNAVDKCADSNPEPILAVLAQDRECQNYTAWKQGWTPREHWEMFQVAELQSLQDRMATQEQAAAAQEKIATEQRILADNRESAREKQREERQTRFQNNMTVYALLASIAAVVLPIWIGTFVNTTQPALLAPVVNVPAPVVNVAAPQVTVVVPKSGDMNSTPPIPGVTKPGSPTP